MANNRELSEFGDFLTVDDTTKNVGIGTTLKITAGGIFVGDTEVIAADGTWGGSNSCLLYTSPSPRDRQKSRMPSSA